MAAVSPFSKDDARTVIKLLAKLDGGRRDLATLREILDVCPDESRWASLFSLLPLDPSSFLIDLGVARSDLISGLGLWCQKFRSRPLVVEPDAVRLHGYACVLVITIITMHESGLEAGGFDDAEDSPSRGQGNDRHHCEKLCVEFLKESTVKTAIAALYDPRGYMPRRIDGNQTKYGTTVSNWGRTDLPQAEFMRHGSTSFILKCKALDGSNNSYEAALKCVLIPYAAISSIADETLRYAENYNADESGANGGIRHMVRVRASSSRWILMDLVPGCTLAQEIERQLAQFKKVRVRAIIGHRERDIGANVRLDVMRRLGLPLLTALDELYRRGRVHQDLSPSNIMVSERSSASGEIDYEFTFIDFGRNYLYARSIGGIEPFSGRYVAPEIRENVTLPEADRWRSDIYSFGQILVSLGNATVGEDGTVPDRFYAQAPLVARVIEDLIDAVPGQRLLVFDTVAASSRPYSLLRQVLYQEIDATQAAISSTGSIDRNVIPYDRETIESAVGGLLPLSKEPKRRRRIYQERKRQNLIDDPRRSFYARWLLGFSIVASFSYYLSALVCFVWFLRDVGIGFLSPVGEAGYRMLGLDQESIPFVDSLRASTYSLGDVGNNLPARLIGLTFALAAARYYQNILGGLTTRVASTPRLDGSTERAVTEFLCRMMSVWGMPLILACNLVNVAWWPIASAIGYSGVLFSNLYSARFADEYIDRARKRSPRRLSTVPPARRKITGLDGYRQWGPTMFFYVLIVWGFALPIYYGVFKDVYVYAIVVGLVNFGLFYVIKTGANALDIRTGLMRAVFAAERLRYIAESERRNDSDVEGRNPQPVGS